MNWITFNTLKHYWISLIKWCLNRFLPSITENMNYSGYPQLFSLSFDLDTIDDNLSMTPSGRSRHAD
jgi:hypothetical protein